MLLVSYGVATKSIIYYNFIVGCKYYQYTVAFAIL
nr:MAG TPA: hypothetical protein [Caudoviricetes sp.]